MRKLTLFLTLVAAPLFAASSLQSLATRSAHHLLRIERSPSGDAFAYNVVVEDADTGAVLLNSHANAKHGEPIDLTGALGTKQVRVHIADTEHFFTATVNIIDGKKIVDEFRTWWQLEPRDIADTPAAGTTPAFNAPDAFRVGGDVKAPVVIHRVNPTYPDEARRNQVEGIVILEVLVGKDGKVKDAAVVKGLPFGLWQSAVDCVRQWTFRPGTLHGEPVDVIFNLTIAFHL